MFSNGVFGDLFSDQTTSSSFGLISMEMNPNGDISAQLLGSGALAFNAKSPVVHPQAENSDAEPKMALQFKVRYAQERVEWNGIDLTLCYQI